MDNFIVNLDDRIAFVIKIIIFFFFFFGLYLYVDMIGHVIILVFKFQYYVNMKFQGGRLRMRCQLLDD
jgi:hypothetical protein